MSRAPIRGALFFAALGACAAPAQKVLDVAAPAPLASPPEKSVGDHPSLATVRDAGAEVRSPTVSANGPPPEIFALSIQVGATTSLVIARVVEDEWVSGAAKVVPQTNSPNTVVRKDVETNKLPVATSAWKGKRVELFGKSGATCEGTVAGLAAVGRLRPHFGTRAAWTSTGDYRGKPKPSATAIAKEAWELSGTGTESGRTLVAELKVEKGNCAGSLWGRPVAPTKPVLVASVPVDAKMRAIAIAELRKTAAWSANQTRYDAEKAASDPRFWDEYQGKVTSLVARHPSGVELVTLSIESGAGCGSFYARLSAVWKSAGGALTLVRDPEDALLAPRSAGDVDGNGSIDLVSEEGLLPAKGGGFGAPFLLAVPDLDCGC